MRQSERKQNKNTGEKMVVVLPPPPSQNLGNDVLSNPYIPPMKTDGYLYPSGMMPPTPAVPGIPINIETRGTGMGYQQVGILTRMSENGMKSDMILPLIGRKLMTGRDKWQYYTISNTGFINTKLPVSRNGKSCTNEYGCDDLYNGDIVYVQGYNDTFRATIYDNESYSYIPF